MESQNNLTQAIQLSNVAKSAQQAGNYDEAASAYGDASVVCMNALVSIYCGQASALVSADNFEDAAKVAESSIRIAPKSSLSWYWKGMALFKVGNFQSAKLALKKAAMLETDLVTSTSYQDWADRCESKLKSINTVGTSSTEEGAQGGSARTTPIAKQVPKQVEAVKSNLRMQWYQSISHVTIDFYAKNVISEESSISFEELRICIQLKRPDNGVYMLEKDLFGSIVPAESTWSVSRFKVELRLKKSKVGEVWKALDRQGQIVSAVAEAGSLSMRRKNETDARQRTLNSITEKELEDYTEDDSSMSLFRTIYKDADEDMKRAMMKSYSESGGQVLSTNWEDVKKEKVTYKENKD